MGLPWCLVQQVSSRANWADRVCRRMQVCFSAVKEVLAKSGVTPRQIGCVIVNCSLFNPTPSLSAVIMNHFKMPSNVINYNLGGMGCSGVCAWL